MKLRELATFRLPLYALRWLVWLVRGAVQKTAVVSTRQGRFEISFQDRVIGRSLYCTRQYELDHVEESLAFLRQRSALPPRGKGTVLDVGANNGVISIGLLHAGEFQRAVAVEPDPANFEFLQRNVAHNRLEDRFVCLPCAAGNRRGQVEFERSGENYGDHRVRAGMPTGERERYGESQRAVTEVPMERLDDLVGELPEPFRQKIAVVWLDVQGFEGLVFRGGREFLSGGAPVVSEIWPYGVRRAGMSPEQFQEEVAAIWPTYWVAGDGADGEDGRFEEQPVSTIAALFDRVGYDGSFTNVVFLR